MPSRSEARDWRKVEGRKSHAEARLEIVRLGEAAAAWPAVSPPTGHGLPRGRWRPSPPTTGLAPAGRAKCALVELPRGRMERDGTRGTRRNYRQTLWNKEKPGVGRGEASRAEVGTIPMASITNVRHREALLVVEPDLSGC